MEPEEAAVAPAVQESEPSSQSVKKIELDIRTQCPFESITVYTTNQAELTRKVRTKLAKGTNEIVLKNLVTGVDSNSIRVVAGRGKGATILEVSVSERVVATGAVPSELYNTLTKEIDGLLEAKQKLTEETARINKEREWIENYSNRFIGGPCAASHASNPSQDFVTMTNAATLVQVGNFLDFYLQRLAVIDEKLLACSKKLTEVEKQIASAEEKRRGTGASERIAEALILIEAPSDDLSVSLLVSYVVSGATWSASYDCRVDSSNKTLQLTYYGAITNRTGEDWVVPELMLSTAKPSLGGAPPELTTKFVGLRPKYGYEESAKSRKRAATSFSAASSVNPVFMQAEWSGADGGGGRGSPSSNASSLSVMTTEAREGGTYAAFAIKRETRIASDNKPHKVTVTVVNLEAKFTYTVAPQLNAHAYLKASIQNTTSTSPFLAGEMNVFMDGNFVAKSSMKATHPGESFALFLGVDDAVKVDSDPLITLNNTSGWIMGKSNIRDVRHKAKIKNTKPFPIDVVVFEQLPKPTDGRVKVKLTVPVINEQTQNIKLTEANNVKWKFESVETGKQIVTVIEYRYEWPLDQVLVE